MESIDKSWEIESTDAYPARKLFVDGGVDDVRDEVQVEHTLDVYLDGTLSMRVVCTPTDLLALVVGRLYTEGIVASYDDIETVYLCEYATKVRVLLKEGAVLRDVTAPVVPSCCTGNKVYMAVENEGGGVHPVTPIPWHPSWVFDLAKRFADDTPMHRKTFGAHSCFLSCDGQILYCCEDLGRHNAFDKVIGRALMDGVDLTRSIIFTSGRLPVDMVTKAIRAGVPILVSKAVPTDLTIELAREYKLTLICSARPDSCKVYNDPQAARLV